VTEWIMANSIRARLVGVALGALAVACSSYAAPISNDAELHLAAAPEDFKALGIGKEIEVREDGRGHDDVPHAATLFIRPRLR